MFYLCSTCSCRTSNETSHSQVTKDIFVVSTDPRIQEPNEVLPEIQNISTVFRAFSSRLVWLHQDRMSVIHLQGTAEKVHKQDPSGGSSGVTWRALFTRWSRRQSLIGLRPGRRCSGRSVQWTLVFWDLG